jgi:hypothetical protein
MQPVLLLFSVLLPNRLPEPLVPPLDCTTSTPVF